MLLRQISTNELIEVLDNQALLNPDNQEVEGQRLWDRVLPEPETYTKSDLCFTSGEDLPLCWVSSGVEHCRP